MIDLNKLAKPDKTIREHTDDLLNKLERLKYLGYLGNEEYEILQLCCEYHDYGKINDEFQKRVSSKKKINFDDTKEVAHNVLSLCFVDENKFRSKEEYYKGCYSILNHHHNVDNFKEIREKEDLIEKNIEKFGGKKLRKRALKKIAEYKTDNQTMFIKGLLHKCDYSASGSYEIEYENDFLSDSLEELGYEWNELQNFCVEKKDENIIVVANTGMGKTEAGLLWIGDNKGFFILPLRTAINAIYDRVREKIIKRNIEQRLSLLHSETLSYYLNKNITEEEKILEYSKRGKQLNMPITISTLDQLFNFVYKYNGFELKLATLSYSKIVIDEIQAYSPDLLAYLISGLEKISELGGKFAILTATLPPFVKDYIEDNIDSINYGEFTKGKIRHHLQVMETELDPLFIENHFKEKGGKVLVVCNTVKKAQEIYDLLKSEDRNINLLHAKFIRNDRSSKEIEIQNFGKTEVNGNGIWIATSIVEASLDIDFDYLFTELNDLNGLFQRLGRVNRKGEKEKMLTYPNAYVFTEINKNLFVNESGTRGFIDKTIYNLSKKAIINFNGLLSEDEKVKMIKATLTTENIKNSNFDREYKKIKKYIGDLYIGEKDSKDIQKIFRNIMSYSVIPYDIYVDLDNRKIIDESLEILRKRYLDDPKINKEENIKKREALKLEKIRARDNIYGLTVSVGIYDRNKIDSIKFGDEEIEITKCKYDFERGFERIKVENKKDEAYDNFG
ncbi:CRISPR-associated helicase Cas3' [uncultured Ilyobacter sp.]|uniref:CRISPR-associated helicase Cas3' n=1 Tax=uncultured Ilyobacter sp. TaxID=544433 RepID=UPI0029F59A20|nr:CRISPR-associated helicase Cas3' [uncultured Ilyobacter sp.]